MPDGMPVGRSWIVVLRNGIIAVDWGDGLFQEIISGDFLEHIKENQVSHRALDSDLDWLIRAGRIVSYDQRQAYFLSLPERSTRTLE
jgi:hypothetical protein